MSDLTHLSLFSGIGGIDLAAEWAGFRTVGQVEKDRYAGKLLRSAFGSRIPLWRDIRDLSADDFERRTGIRYPTVLSGGFPCQPFSCAGKRRGKHDDRFLWPEMRRVIAELRPAWIIGENVAGFASMVQFNDEPPMEEETCYLIEDGEVYPYHNARGNPGDRFERTGIGVCEEILEEIEAEGYTVRPFVIPACGIGAPHQRARVFIVAHTDERGFGETDQAAMPLGENAGSWSNACCSNWGQLSGNPYEEMADSSSRGRTRAPVPIRQRRQDKATCHSRGSCKDVSDASKFVRNRCRPAGTGRGTESPNGRIRDDPYSLGKHDDGSGYGTGEVCRKRGEEAEVLRGPDVANSKIPRLERSDTKRYSRSAGCLDQSQQGGWDPHWWDVEPGMGRVAHGVPHRVDRLRCLGNAVVPAQVYPILASIAQIEGAIA